MSGEKIILRQVQVLDPKGEYHLQTMDIGINPSGTLFIPDQDETSGDGSVRVIDASKSYISPGWVDVGTTIQDPGGEWKETVEALAAAAKAGGFTTLLPYPSTIPIPDNGEIIRGLISRYRHLPVLIKPIGAASEHLSGKEMSGLYDMYQAGAAIFSDGAHSLSSAGTLLRILKYLKSFDGRLITGAITPEWAESGQMHEGDVSTSLGLPGIPDVAEVISVERDLNILRYVGAGRIHFAPLSVPAAIEIVFRASEEGLDVTTGAWIDHFRFTDADLISFDENLKVIPPFRSKEDLKKMIQLLKEGKIDILSTGHKAEGIEEKQVEFSQAEHGMLSLQSAFPSAVGSLLRPGHITVEHWINLISVNARERFSLDPAHIRDNGNEWTWFTVDRETTLTRNSILSRAKNSPFIDRTLPGRVLGCASNGHLHLDQS